MASFTVTGAPKFTEVETSAALLAAIIAAKPGEVVTLTEVVDPFELNLATPKAAPGICIVLPASQIVMTTFGNGNLNTEVIGGVHSYDLASGELGGRGTYSVNMSGNPSYFALRGATISHGNTLIAHSGLSVPHNFEITDCLWEWARVDGAQLTGAHHFLIARNIGRDMTIKGRKMLWFKDGDPNLSYPDGGLPIDDSPDLGNGTTRFWVDGPHSDALQIHSEPYDFAVIDNDFTPLGAGIVSYGIDTFTRNWTRALIEGNYVRSLDGGAIYAEGDHVTVVNNTIGRHPSLQGANSVRITFRYKPSIGSKMQGGLNTFETGASWTLIGPSIDPTAPLNGDDGVEYPELPNLHRLPWAPEVTRPAYVPYTGVPEIIARPVLYSSPNPPGLGDWITTGLGGVKAADVPTYEVRWVRNSSYTPTDGSSLDGTVIGTQRTVQVTESEIGQFVWSELRATDTNGTGPWRASNPRQPA